MINIIIMLLLFTIISFVASTTYTLSTNQFNKAYHDTLTHGDIVLLTSDTIRSGTIDSGWTMIHLTKGINVICEGSLFMSSLCDFDASSSRRVIYFTNVPVGQMIWLYGLLVQNGSGHYGGGVFVLESSSTLENIHFEKNVAENVSI